MKTWSISELFIICLHETEYFGGKTSSAFNKQETNHKHTPKHEILVYRHTYLSAKNKQRSRVRDAVYFGSNDVKSVGTEGSMVSYTFTSLST